MPDRTKSRTVAQRLWAKIELTDGHWMWTGAVSSGGYGRILVDGSPRYVHRVAYELS